MKICENPARLSLKGIYKLDFYQLPLLDIIRIIIPRVEIPLPPKLGFFIRLLSNFMVTLPALTVFTLCFPALSRCFS